ncbi:unnamed protein product [Rhodiola kirilowii]
MELPELSLAAPTCCSSSESSGISSSSRKRKALSDNILEQNKSLLQQAHRNIDLQHSSERLPFDWEQCLDLESSKMYFLNRKTLKRSWDRPTTNKDQQYRQKLNLELNISSQTTTAAAAAGGVTNKPKPPSASVSTNNCYSINKPDLRVLQITRKNDHHGSAAVANYSNYDKTVAMACRNCHMLVIVSKSSPTCPNCKYVHSIPAPGKPTFKPLDTLSLFS